MRRQLRRSCANESGNERFGGAAGGGERMLLRRLLDAAQIRLSGAYFERDRLFESMRGSSPRLGPAILAERDLAKVYRMRLAAHVESRRPLRGGDNDIPHLAAVQTCSSRRRPAIGSRRPERGVAARQITTENRQAAAGAKDVRVPVL